MERTYVEILKNYIFESYTDRERLYNQFELFRDVFHQKFLQTLKLGNLSTDPKSANWRVIDACCGEGLWTREVTILYPHTELVGFDIDPEAIMTANMVFSREGNLHFYEHDVLKPLPAEFISGNEISKGYDFDVALSILGILHTKDTHLALKNIIDALKPGGVIYMFDPIADWFRFPHPSAKFLETVFNEAWQKTSTYDFGSNHTRELAKVGITEVETIAYPFPLGGETPYGWRMLTYALSLIEAARKTLVDRLHLIDNQTLDEHINRIKNESTPNMKGTIPFVITIARKPL